jgi:tRNA(adenine34) deaminase
MAFPLPEPMRLALQEAAAAAAAGEVPVGAVVARAGEPIVAARNRMRTDADPTAHAEMVALRAAGRALGTSRLDECDLWVTLEPCAMCAGAIALARIRRLYVAALDPKGGAVVHGPRLFAQPTCHHAPELYTGIGEESAGDLLRRFFRERRV